MGSLLPVIPESALMSDVADRLHQTARRPRRKQRFERNTLPVSAKSQGPGSVGWLASRWDAGCFCTASGGVASLNHRKWPRCLRQRNSQSCGCRLLGGRKEGHTALTVGSERFAADHLGPTTMPSHLAARSQRKRGRNPHPFFHRLDPGNWRLAQAVKPHRIP